MFTLMSTLMFILIPILILIFPLPCMFSSVWACPKHCQKPAATSTSSPVTLESDLFLRYALIVSSLFSSLLSSLLHSLPSPLSSTLSSVLSTILTSPHLSFLLLSSFLVSSPLTLLTTPLLTAPPLCLNNRICFSTTHTAPFISTFISFILFTYFFVLFRTWTNSTWVTILLSPRTQTNSPLKRYDIHRLFILFYLSFMWWHGHPLDPCMMRVFFFLWGVCSSLHNDRTAACILPSFHHSLIANHGTLLPPSLLPSVLCISFSSFFSLLLNIINTNIINIIMIIRLTRLQIWTCHCAWR